MHSKTTQSPQTLRSPHHPLTKKTGINYGPEINKLEVTKILSKSERVTPRNKKVRAF